MRGNPDSAPKSAAESVVGDVSPRANRYDSLSTSKLRQTATRASPGQDLGVSFCPTRAGATAARSCSSVQRVPGCAGKPCCWARAEIAQRMYTEVTDTFISCCSIYPLTLTNRDTHSFLPPDSSYNRMTKLAIGTLIIPF